MKITLIGAGNLATHLGKALRNAGHDMLQVYSRTTASAAQLAAQLAAQPTNDTTQITRNADVYIFAVSDDALPELIPQIVKGREEKLFIHTSGSIPIHCFHPLARRYGVIYPLQTFSKQREINFSEIPLFLEADSPQTEREIQSIAGGISANHRFLSSADRQHLHLAAVWACNFTNHCYDIAAQILEEHGLPFQLILPLTDETARKLHQLHPHQAQTGPALRSDQNIIRSQANLLTPHPQLKALYEQLTQSIHQQHKNNNHD